MEFLLGAAGAAMLLGAFGAGAAAGWRVCKELKTPPAKAEPPQAEVLKRMQEGQEAFRSLQNYSAERAYGMLRSEEAV